MDMADENLSHVYIKHIYIVKAKFSINVSLRSFLQLFITITFDFQWQITKLKNTTWRLVSEMWTKTEDRTWECPLGWNDLTFWLCFIWKMWTWLTQRNIDVQVCLALFFCHKLKFYIVLPGRWDSGIIKYTILPDPDFFKLIKIFLIGSNVSLFVNWKSSKSFHPLAMHYIIRIQNNE